MSDNNQYERCAREVARAAADLQASGFLPSHIVDALMTIAVRGGCLLAGPEAVAATLRDWATKLERGERIEPAKRPAAGPGPVHH